MTARIFTFTPYPWVVARHPVERGLITVTHPHRDMGDILIGVAPVYPLHPLMTADNAAALAVAARAVTACNYNNQRARELINHNDASSRMRGALASMELAGLSVMREFDTAREVIHEFITK